MSPDTNPRISINVHPSPTRFRRNRLITGRPVRRAACLPVWRLLSGPKMFFRPAGATHCADKDKVWHGEADGALPVPNFTFIGEKLWEYSS